MAFEAQNELERSLVRAASDPAHRPQFYRDLVAAKLLVVQEGVPPPDGPREMTVTAGISIQLQHLEYEGRPCIPVFSSLARLQEFVTEPVTYLAFDTLDFLQMTAGTGLLLNPGADYGKEITADEARSIVDGSIWRPESTHVTERETQVLLGHPARYPHELVDALKRLFAKDKRVQRAWVAHFHDPSRGDPPHTLIALQASDAYEAIAAEVGVVAGSVSIPDPPVDVMPVGQGSGLDGYFLKESKPFYRKRLLGIF